MVAKGKQLGNAPCVEVLFSLQLAWLMEMLVQLVFCLEMVNWSTFNF